MRHCENCPCPGRAAGPPAKHPPGRRRRPRRRPARRRRSHANGKDVAVDSLGRRRRVATRPCATCPFPSALATPWQRRLRRRKQLVWLTQLAAAAAVLVRRLRMVWGDFAGDRTTASRRPALTASSVARAAKPQDDKLQASLAARAAAPARRRDGRPSCRTCDSARREGRCRGGAIASAGRRSAEGHRRLSFAVDPRGDRPLEELPEPKKAVGLIRRGIDWPLAPGSNYFFLARYGVHPFVSPAADPRLQSIVAPLGGDGSSFELTRRCLEDKELPPPDEVRTEDFLAAMNYDFPHPTQQALGDHHGRRTVALWRRGILALASGRAGARASPPAASAGPPRLGRGRFGQHELGRTDRHDSPRLEGMERRPQPRRSPLAGIVQRGRPAVDRGRRPGRNRSIRRRRPLARGRRSDESFRRAGQGVRRGRAGIGQGPSGRPRRPLDRRDAGPLAGVGRARRPASVGGRRPAASPCTSSI